MLNYLVYTGFRIQKKEFYCGLVLQKGNAFNIKPKRKREEVALSSYHNSGGNLVYVTPYQVNEIPVNGVENEKLWIEQWKHYIHIHVLYTVCLNEGAENVS